MARSLRKTEKRKLMVFERKILRKIFKPTENTETGDWETRKNNELKSLFQK